jgi:hypothetical protein
MAGVNPVVPPATPTAATRPQPACRDSSEWIAINTRTTFVHPSRTPIAAHAGPAELPAYGEDERGTGNALEHLIRAALPPVKQSPGTYRGASDQYVIELDDESWAEGFSEGRHTSSARTRRPLASPADSRPHIAEIRGTPPPCVSRTLPLGALQASRQRGLTVTDTL